MPDPINPLENPAADLPPLPAPEVLEDPLPPEPEPPAAPAPAQSNGNGNASASKRDDLIASLQAELAARAGSAGRTAPQGPIVGDVRHLGAIQSDVEQLHAEAGATRRAVQLLAVSLAAIAALALLYTIRAARAGAGAGGAA